VKCQVAGVVLHLPHDGGVGLEQFARRGLVADEVAEVDAGNQSVGVCAGKPSHAMLAEVGLQPAEDFFLCFHGGGVCCALLARGLPQARRS